MRTKYARRLALTAAILLTNGLASAASHTGTVQLGHLNADVAGRGICVRTEPQLPGTGWACLWKNNYLYHEIEDLLRTASIKGNSCTLTWSTNDSNGDARIAIAECNPPPTIQFVITTGDDDLGVDSSATASLRAPDGSTLQVITLKTQSDPSWGNNATHTVSVGLTPSPSAIDNIVVTLISQNDNWNIQKIIVSVSNTTVGSKQLLDGSGNPLARLSGTEPSLTLPFVPVLARPVCPPGTPCTNVTTYHNDSQRTGWNPSEVTLTPASVTPTNFKRLATVLLDDQVDTQPLFFEGVVYVATERNTIYAINFQTGMMRIRNLGVPVTPALNPKLSGCWDNGPNIGITGTPVIDATTRTLYATVYTMDSGQPAYELRALDLATLADRAGSPALVSATQTLKDGTSFSFNATYERQRPALLLSNHRVYTGFGSFCDWYYHDARGWVLGWDKTSLAALPRKELTARTPGDAGLSAVWMSGYGLAADASSDLYFATGNTAGANYDSTFNLSNSAIRLSGDLSHVVSFFTPSNVNDLDLTDMDLGSGGLMVLPDQPGPFQHLAVAAGKDGRMFVLNRDNMGGKSSTPDIPANVDIGTCYCGPSYFESGLSNNKVSYVVSSGGVQVNLWSPSTTGGPSNIRPSLNHVASSGDITTTYPPKIGFFTSISSNGTAPHSAIIWAVGGQGGPAASDDHHLKLYAIDATPVNGKLLPPLWSDVAGFWPPWAPDVGGAHLVPTVVNGRVYVASHKQLQIFGLP